MNTLKCTVCPHGCVLSQGAVGRCKARQNTDGRIKSINYGIVTSLALDPIEKKPLNRFYPGSRIVSVGSFGCNLGCPFCQNHEIAAVGIRDILKPDEVKAVFEGRAKEAVSDNYISPEELVQIAIKTKPKGNIGVAFTYNEPLIGYEYVLDTARLVRDAGLKTVLVTNGCVTVETSEKILPYTDALNIDLKSFRPEIYRDTLGGDFEAVKEFIKRAASQCHVELTTLIVPGINDSLEEMQKISEWIASLPGGDKIPLHITRFFPRYRLTDREPTDVELILKLTEVAREKLEYVYPGNI
ncbi:MAG: AmmeMemoRadiSam system radical SAM enzyme [Lachnospiraceae bacterium]|nr:AmmeMemoRadiSam system radical SAM enzyme [Lachnospiraceae bacterium]